MSFFWALTSELFIFFFHSTISQLEFMLYAKRVSETRFTLEEIVPDSLMFPDSSNLEYPDL